MSNPNTWTNEYGDRIVFNGVFNTKGGNMRSYSVTLAGEYKKAFGGLSAAKSFINKERGARCKWVETTE